MISRVSVGVATLHRLYSLSTAWLILEGLATVTRRPAGTSPVVLLWYPKLPGQDNWPPGFLPGGQEQIAYTPGWGVDSWNSWGDPGTPTKKISMLIEELI